MGQSDKSDKSSEDDTWGDMWSGPGHAWSEPGSSAGRPGSNDPSTASTGEQWAVSDDEWSSEPHQPPTQPPTAPQSQGTSETLWQPSESPLPPPPGQTGAGAMPPGYPPAPPVPRGLPERQEKQSGGNGAKITLAVVLALILVPVIGVLGYMLAFTGDESSTEAQAADDGNNSDTQTVVGSEMTDSESGDSGGRADGFQPPATWEQCSGDGDLGQLNYSYSATTVTSCPFAIAVRDAVAQHYHDSDGETDSVLNVRSPVTGTTYTMTCTDDGTVITCDGGDNAVVKVV